MLKRIEYIIKNLLLKLLSFISKGNEKPYKRIELSSNSKVLLIRLNRIGDALVTTPFINILNKAINCEIYILADKKNYFVFENNKDIKEIIVFRKGLINFFYIVKKINSYNFDLIIDMHDDVSTTVSFLIALSKSNFKLGFEKSNKNIFTHTIKRPDPNKFHIVERLCSFSEILGFDYDEEQVKIIYNPNQSSIKEADDLIKSIFVEQKFILGINISAGSDARFWGKDRYKLLIEKLKKFDLNVIIICHKKDYIKAESIIDSKFIIDTTNDFNFYGAVIKKLNMLFSPDTSAVHLAAVDRIPVFGLYVKYKLNELIWSPYNTDFDCVITEEPTLGNVTFDEVWNKFESFLIKHLSIYNEFSKRI